MGRFSWQIIAKIFAEILWPTYRFDELSARPLTLSRVSTGDCEMYTCVLFGVRQARVTSCTCGQWHSCTFQRATGAWNVFALAASDTRVTLLINNTKILKLVIESSDFSGHSYWNQHQQWTLFSNFLRNSPPPTRILKFTTILIIYNII